MLMNLMIVFSLFLNKALYYMKSDQNTAIYYAVDKGSTEMAQILIDNGADVNATDNVIHI